VTLNVLHSEFAHGRNLYKSSDSTSPFVHGGGLGIYFEEGFSAVEDYHTIIYNCSMYTNTTSVGAN